MISGTRGIMAFLPCSTPDISLNFQDNNHHLPSTSPKLFPSPSLPHQDHFNHDVPSMLMRRSMSFSGVERCNNHVEDNEMSDEDGSSQLLGEKKRRLNMEQVKALERSFEVANKLDPERKIQLARALGLQPRQIAIWFQNRRARWKTKQLEKDYEILKRHFDSLKTDNDALKAQNKELHSELQLLSVKKRESSGAIIMFNLNKENEGCWSNNGSDDNNNNNSIDVNLGTRTSSGDSPFYSKNNVFPPEPGPVPLAQFLQSSSTPPDHLNHCNKNNIDPTVQHEGFCNMFTPVDDQTNFWPWPEQQHFN